MQASRDITALSKKAIFLLHRTAADPARAAAAARPKLREIQDLFARLRDELAGELYWRHVRAVSGGVQEYIEALAFAHYLEHNSLVTFTEVQRSLSDDGGAAVSGLSFVGIDRRADALIHAVFSTHGRRLPTRPVRPHWGADALRHIRDPAQRWPGQGGRGLRIRPELQSRCVPPRAPFSYNPLRHCTDFELFVPHLRDLRKKQQVTSSSLQKIEDGAHSSRPFLANLRPIGVRF